LAERHVYDIGDNSGRGGFLKTRGGSREGDGSANLEKLKDDKGRGVTSKKLWEEISNSQGKKHWQKAKG